MLEKKGIKVEWTSLFLSLIIVLDAFKVDFIYYGGVDSVRGLKMFFLGIFWAYISNYIRSIRILAVIDSVLLITGGSIVFLVERKKVFIVLLLLSLCILNMLVVERIVNFRINDEKSKLIKLFNRISFEVYVLHIPIYALLNLLIMISKINIRPELYQC